MGGTIITARPLSIPWSAIHAWCDRARCTADDREFIRPLVAALDQEFLADWARKQNKTPTQSLADKVARWEAS